MKKSWRSELRDLDSILTFIEIIMFTAWFGGLIGVLLYTFVLEQ